MSKTDLNKAAETILIPLLNEVYGWSLENINYLEENNNYPGIDLADEVAGISVQVTATPDLKKVKHTLEQFTKRGQYLKYNRLVIYILKKKQDSYSESAIQGIIQSKFNFDSQKDIWDHCDILKEVSNFPIERTLKVQEILEAYFGEDQKFPSLLVDSLEQRIDWREASRELLNHWKGLTTNVLTKPNGVRFQLDEIFVPLGVVERREKPKHRCNDGFPAEQGSELYEEKVTPISQNDFFEQVLLHGQSKHSQGSRIAIIGEPGAGKTTQLQKIGDWILTETDGIPIWIPLTAVGTRTLKDYLLSDWLQTAIEELDVSQGHRDELGQLLKTGKVWLLLDGVDEMAISDALYQIGTQMHEGWLRNVRVVLTCRLNVWDAGKNALDDFDVYRNLDFEYPTEVHQLLDQWFATEPDLQQKLKVALEQPGKERIRDMVKNPLRLTLLCYSWQLRQGELPETKAGLYKWFVDTFYEWNKGKVPTKLSVPKREELNRALAELAKEAIDQKTSRFRLREKFINRFLGDADDEDSLFHLALHFGWLNRIGVAAENPLENVYAFFHPTFQEYFAALVIPDWHFFLNHISNDPDTGTYRIFESGWQGVILFWLGRLGREIPDDQKKLFINELYHFDDGCGNNFFSLQALILAALGINEFFESNLASSIISTLLELKVGYLDEDQQKWLSFPELFLEQVNFAIMSSNETILQERISLTLAEIRKLEVNDISLLEIIELIDLLSKTQDGKLQAVKEVAVFFEEYGNTRENFCARSKYEKSFSLEELSQRDSLHLYLSYIFHELSNSIDRILNSPYKYELGKSLEETVKNIEFHETKLFIELILFKLNAIQEEVYNLIEPFIGEDDTGKYLFAISISHSLKIDLHQELDLLIDLFKGLDRQNAFWQNQIIIVMSNFLENETISANLEFCLSEHTSLPDTVILNIAYRIAKKKPTHTKALHKLICALNSPERSIRQEAAKMLSELPAHSLKVVNVLNQDIQQVERPERIGIAFCILDIDPQNEEAIKALVEYFNLVDFLYYDDLTNKVFVEVAIPIACRLLSGGFFRPRYIQAVVQSFTRFCTLDAQSVEMSDFSDAQFNTALFWCSCRALEYCTQNMSYPDFCRAWHSSSSDHAEYSQMIEM